MNFFDDTEVLLWADRRWATFKGKSKARRTYDLGDVASVPDLAKRIKVCCGQSTVPCQECRAHAGHG